MLISEDHASDCYFIESHQHNELVISGKQYHTSIFLTAHQLMNSNLPNNPEALTCKILSDLISKVTQSIELLIIGTGRSLYFFDEPLMKFLDDHHISVEVMNTKNACKTFNILAGEGRSVAAILQLQPQ